METALLATFHNGFSSSFLEKPERAAARQSHAITIIWNLDPPGGMTDHGHNRVSGKVFSLLCDLDGIVRQYGRWNGVYPNRGR
jgi:hypothetical protein